MKAHIYQPTKNAMQSGRGKTAIWLLEFETQERRFKDPVMGWTSSSEMDQQVKLRFDTKEEAIKYAEREGLQYSVADPKQRKIILKSYADNFAAS